MAPSSGVPSLLHRGDKDKDGYPASKEYGLRWTLFGGHVSKDKTDKFQENIAVKGQQGPRTTQGS